MIGGCFLICDGHDRGPLQVVHSKLAYTDLPFIWTKAFTGAVPFSDRPPEAVVPAIVGGERPPRPTHPAFTEKLWGLAQRCWDQEAHKRPQTLKIVCDL